MSDNKETVPNTGDHGVDFGAVKPIDIASLGEDIGPAFEKIQADIDAAKKEPAEQPKDTVKIDGVPDMTVDQIAKVMLYIREFSDKTNQIREMAQLLEIKKSPDLHSQSVDFLLDMCGGQPYQRTFKAGVVEVTFELLSSDDISVVNQQCVRDMQQGRTVSNEENLFFIYKMAMSIVKLTLQPPGQAVNTVYDRLPTLTDGDRSELGLSKFDLLPRAQYVRLLQTALKSSIASKIVSQKFMKFETDVDNLILLATKEPDFFLESSTEGS